MTPAETLMEAARLMRTRALVSEGFTPPWYVDAAYRDGWLIGYTTDNPLAGLIATTADYVPLGTADHIASWHPTVALAVADVLEMYAGFDGAVDWSADGPTAVLNVARAYLGGAA